ncbi:hypothetical protein BDDG_07617 [Blastomyces dermatitidis ATCC 18188]|uniref:HNH nuclease domain-containing protein n=1 Tax=Ajellomyces dermatitidis (strain ATCC 18188 / CBS 674.68) TaxID=653446 RepID=F2TN59_AJEDA|nr:hypothetical protein BDDG_07617 [Blastomyces dermatitidis ATCC 18188]
MDLFDNINIVSQRRLSRQNPAPRARLIFASIARELLSIHLSARQVLAFCHVKRFEMSSTSWQSDIPKSDTFSGSTKLEVKRLAGDQCWACGAPNPQVCHVFGKEDPQIQLNMVQCNLIDFDLTSAENGIALCAGFHVQFDQTADPGFVLLPVDLQYFIDVELDDIQEKKLALKNGKDVEVHRRVPTVVEYKAHQHNDAQRSLPTQNYLVDGRLPSNVLNTLSTPKQWHGAPVATLRRGILVLGGGRVQSLDAETRSQLELLQNLYFLNDEEYSPADHSKQMQSVVQRGQKRSLDDEQGRRNKLPKLNNLEYELENKSADEDITSRRCPPDAII